MAIAHNLATAEEGWTLVSHFLGNNLTAIAMHVETHEDEVVEAKWVDLVGNLYVIIRHMRSSGLDDEASKMQEILDMIVDQDVTDPAVRTAIGDKHSELSLQQRNFQDEVARLRAEHSKPVRER